MQLVQVFIQLEAAHEAVDELGKVGMIQFKDLNGDTNVFQRNFATEVRKADELERQIRFFESQVEAEVEIADLIDPVTVEITDETNTAFHLDELATKFDNFESELTELNSRQAQLSKNYNELVEFKHVLQKDADFFSGYSVSMPASDIDENTALVGEGENLYGGADQAGLGFITGLVNKDKLQSFERVLWRVVRGNLYMKTAEIDTMVIDPATGEQVHKVVFIVFFQGARSRSKITKICDSFGANTYRCSQDEGGRRELLDSANEQLRVTGDVLTKSHDHRRELLVRIGNYLESWSVMVTKEKAIYHTMNLFNYDVGRRCLIAEGWVPSTSLDEVQEAVDRASQRSGARIVMHSIETREKPPTFFRTNKYTAAFQGIIDSYGTARYKEVNPGVFTMVTFPFLFGIMFGDVGHGVILTLVAIAFIVKEKSLSETKLNEIISMLFNARYLLLFMGLFSIYCGSLYNEYFSVPADWFGTRWVKHSDVEDYMHWDCDHNIAYPYGVDPAWKGATNEISFYNSLKMKMSVIVAVIHMTVGIILSLFNHVYFRQPINIIFEFIPQMLFFCSLFGYMDVLIIIKWCTHYVDPSKAPGLISAMIDIFLKVKVTEENALFNPWAQSIVQYVIIVLVIVSIPWMLLPKPISLWILSKRKKNFVELNRSSEHGTSSDLEYSDEVGESPGGDEHDEDHFDFSEEFVHQIIHTIEFVLSGISHTASYLRLWALSLAHSELATVFWNRVLVRGFTTRIPYAQFILIFVTVAAWAAATAVVLLVMESLSAFLHALRLHWVEFQSKFFYADGYPFEPFSYERIFSNDEED